jgi:hypothetical protein
MGEIPRPMNELCTQMQAPAPMRRAGLRDLFWDKGETITIGWIGGNAFLWQNVV